MIATDAEIEEMLAGLRCQFDALAVEIAATRKALIAARCEPYIGKEEAAEFLGVCTKTLERRMALPDGPPRYVDGGRVSFLRSELRVWRRQWRAGDQTGLESTRT